MNTYRICLETHSIKEAGKIVEELRKLNRGEILMTEMPEWYESINDEKIEDNQSNN